MAEVFVVLSPGQLGVVARSLTVLLKNPLEIETKAIRQKEPMLLYVFKCR